MSKQKTKINDTLNEFLFNKIKRNPGYRLWAENYKIPEYITDNINPNKILRDYQIDAVKHFIWLYENDRVSAKHLLFNMATGTGKTLVMACCVLYLYEKGYRNFLFLVHQIPIKEQAESNFTNYKHEKYLFNPNGIKINGIKVNVQVINTLQDTNNKGINFLFFSTALLYNRLKEDIENGITAEDFVKNNIVILADEAHRLNVDTRSKNKKDVEEILNWETAVLSAITARSENMLLEFTATVDLANDNIHSKYKNKLVCRYDFLQFNKDGYSKDVKFLFNQETQIEDQKKLLIVNAVILSEYRRLLAERTMDFVLNPIVLIKSIRIAESEKDREFFDQVIGSLRPSDLKRLQQIGGENKNREHEILSDMFKWLHNQNISLEEFTASIRASFAHDNTLIYNSQKKEKANLLLELDSPRNIIRAIFSVSALNEGWDVLGLFDIIHFDISAEKKVSLQDIQLIGRGARYFPYKLPKKYLRDESGMFESMQQNLQTDKYKRKFDNDPLDTGRILETFVYHFVKTGTFLENLQRDLLGEGIINDGVEKRTIMMKSEFLNSDTYKKGFVLVNRTEKRNKTTGDDIDRTFKKIIQATSYNLRAIGLSDREQNQHIASLSYKKIRITEEFFSVHIIKKALIKAEGNFFRFNNLCKHITDLTTIDDFITKYLPLYEIKYTYEQEKDIQLLNPKEKLQLLSVVILHEVRKSIDLNMPKIIGSNKFRPVPLQMIFGKEKSIYLASFPTVDSNTGKKVFITYDERSKEQTNNQNFDLRYDVKTAKWYAYDENYGTSEEKKFVKWIATQINNLQTKYPQSEIYVIRNELDYWLFSPADGRRFSPDYLLIINDHLNKKMYYQCIVEPKGGHLLLQDEWKEQTLISLSTESELVFDIYDDDKQSYKEYLKEIKNHGYQKIENIGLKFFNTEPRQVEEFALNFRKELLD